MGIWDIYLTILLFLHGPIAIAREVGMCRRWTTKRVDIAGHLNDQLIRHQLNIEKYHTVTNQLVKDDI